MFREIETKTKVEFLSNFETIAKLTIYKLINKKNEKKRKKKNKKNN